MGKFFDFVGMDGKTIEEKSLSFVRKSEEGDNQWKIYLLLTERWP
jgi:hypothetical protein